MTEELELTLEQAMERALTLQREGQLDAAEELYEQIIQHQPDHADAWHFRGLVALQGGRRDEALRFIDQAVALSPGYADALNNRGNVLFMMKRHEEALGAWQQALEVRPDMAEAHFNLGRYHAAGGKKDGAFLLDAGPLAVGVGLRGGKSEIVLAGPRTWFREQAERQEPAPIAASASRPQDTTR